MMRKLEIGNWRLERTERLIDAGTQGLKVHNLFRGFIFVVSLYLCFSASIIAGTQVLTGHESSVSCVEFTSDGRYILSGSFDGSIKIWEVSTGALERTLIHGNAIEQIAVSDNSKYIASAGRDKALKIWDFKTGKLLRSFSEFDDTVYSVAFSHDNTYVAGGSRNSIIIWRLSDFKKAATLHIGDAWARDISFSKDGRRFIAAISDWLYVWKYETSGILNQIIGRDKPIFRDRILYKQGAKVYSAGFSDDSSYCAAAGEHEFMSLWRVEDGMFVWGSRIHKALIWSLDFAPDNKYVATAGKDGVVNIIRIDDRSTVLSLKNSDEVYDIDFSPAGGLIASAVRDGTVVIEPVPFIVLSDGFKTKIIIYSASGVLLIIIVVIIGVIRNSKLKAAQKK